MGIACAVTAVRGQDEHHTKAWTGKLPDGSIAPRMSQEEARQRVDYLAAQTLVGRTIVTWNGMGFDWPVLAEESDLLTTCRELARQHVDMMYHLFCVKGFPLGLNAAAQGMDIGNKTEGISGVDAPQLWQEGKHQQVIDYCAQDTSLTLDVAIKTQQAQRLDWVARSGRLNTLRLPGGWLPVEKAQELPLPDTSWMNNPLQRQTFDEWLRPQ